MTQRLTAGAGKRLSGFPQPVHRAGGFPVPGGGADAGPPAAMSTDSGSHAAPAAVALLGTTGGSRRFPLVACHEGRDRFSLGRRAPAFGMEE